LVDEFEAVEDENDENDRIAPPPPHFTLRNVFDNIPKVSFFSFFSTIFLIFLILFVKECPTTISFLEHVQLIALLIKGSPADHFRFWLRVASGLDGVF